MKITSIKAKVPATLDTSLWWGIIVFPGLYCKASDSKTTWKKSFCACHYCHPPKLTTVMSGISTPTMLFPPLEIPAGPLSRTKGSGGETAIICHQALSRPLDVAAVTVPAYPVSAFSQQEQTPFLIFDSRSQTITLSFFLGGGSYASLRAPFETDDIPALGNRNLDGKN